MKLYIVRHAWAGEHGDPRYPDDRLRPLSDEGRQRFACLLKKLPAAAFSPELIATSPLVRCRQTAELVAESVDGSPEIVERQELAPGSDLGALLAWTSRQKADSVAWVGHAPDVGQLVAALIGDSTASLRLAKGAICQIEFDGPPAAGRGELAWLVTAKVLGC